MQQINSDSGDRKITSDSFVDSDIPHSTVVELPADFPPESFWLSKDAEFDWFDQTAFLERKESTRGNSNSMNLNPNINPNYSNSSSTRYSVKVKSKAAIIGLPKTQKTTYVDSKRRQCNVRLFPNRSNSIGKLSTTVLVTEPSSPKVSCMGRVRSKRCRSRWKSSEFGSQSLKSTSQRSGNGTSRKQKSGLMSRLTSLFRSDGNRRRKNGKTREKVKEPLEMSGSRRICVTVKPVYSEPATPSEQLGLGGMLRFASGRRSEYSGGFDDVDDVAACHSLDFAHQS